MNKILKFWIFIFILFSDFLVFADDGPGDDDGGCIECDDAPAAPINAKLIWLALVGIVFVWFLYKRKNTVSQQ